LWVNVKGIRYGYFIPLAVALVFWLLWPFDFIFGTKYTAQTSGTVTYVQSKKSFRQSQYKGSYEYVSAYIVNYHFSLDTQIFYNTNVIAPQRINARMWQKLKNQLNQNVFHIKYNPENPEENRLVLE
jgi:hypothetical protein